jgi:hypothetical protein
VSAYSVNVRIGEKLNGFNYCRLALARPDAITAIISQNGNAFDEGLGDFWDHIRPYWAEQTKEKRESLRWLTTFGTTKSQVGYFHIASPYIWTLLLMNFICTTIVHLG